MQSVLIPLVGMIEIDEITISGVCLMTGAILKKDVKVDEELWEILTLGTITGRYKSVNDYLRERFGLEPLNARVKRFSDEQLPPKLMELNKLCSIGTKLKGKS